MIYIMHIMKLCLNQFYTPHYLGSAINCPAIHSSCSERLLLLQWQQRLRSLFHVGELPRLLQERPSVRGDDPAQRSTT